MPGLRMAMTAADGGKHGGPPDDQPWPVPDEEPSPDGSRPQELTR
ncbi:hypothetical protein [Streptomyces purpurogeneiscleroticus]|nr:hypothetical protein [Streptomyces purpurogeneiscleroticus]